MAERRPEGARGDGRPPAGPPRGLAPTWLRDYRRAALPGDLAAGAVVAALLIPQSMAYAQLAGLPPQAGLYASILPVAVYALLGSSPTLAVGPVAMVSLMVAAALGPLAAAGSADYAALALTLALMVGILQAALGLLRLGGLVHLLSHAVIAGFTSGAALLIAVGQLRPLFGLKGTGGDRLTQLLAGLPEAVGRAPAAGAALGLGTLAAILLVERLRLPPRLAAWRKLGPLAAVGLASLAVVLWQLDGAAGVAVVGAVPAGLPQLTWPAWDAGLWRALAAPAAVIGLAGFAESYAMAQALAGRSRGRPRPDRELLALGAANLGAAFSGAFPVTGGFSRTMVNQGAGATSPLASLVSAGLMALSVAWLTPYLARVPQAALAAVILAAVLRLLDVATFRRLWAYDRAEAALMLLTFGGVLLLGVERGLLAGLAATLALQLWRAAQPHVAVLGRVPDTEHYRNVLRHRVLTQPAVLALRVDESLSSLNIGFLRDRVQREVAARPAARHLLLVCSAVNGIEGGALMELEALVADLRAAGVTTHLAEVKGPVQDRLDRAGFPGRLAGGRIFLSTHEAMRHLESAPAGLPLAA